MARARGEQAAGRFGQDAPGRPAPHRSYAATGSAMPSTGLVHRAAPDLQRRDGRPAEQRAVRGVRGHRVTLGRTCRAVIQATRSPRCRPAHSAPARSCGRPGFGAHPLRPADVVQRGGDHQFVVGARRDREVGGLESVGALVDRLPPQGRPVGPSIGSAGR
ncbi:hypothetical protein [Streptomyces sp. NPDC059224]|uniref:hypothetical protein n=1 Tax=Streptomyces sp. NPDC059224 TaxID=3346775 RepID=UPI00368E5EF5